MKANEGAAHLIKRDTSPLQVHTHANFGMRMYTAANKELVGTRMQAHAFVCALRRRAQSLINDKSIDAESRALIRYGLEINDPCLAELVCRADAGERVIDALERSEISGTGEDNSGEEKVEALAELICRTGDEPEIKSAALFVLMGTLEHSTDPKLLANLTKHFAFSRCGEFNLYGMVDAQIEVVEGELLTSNTLIS